MVTKIQFLKKIIKDNHAYLSHYENEKLYYRIWVKHLEFIFPVDTKDFFVKSGRFEYSMKAIKLMRYIRLAIDEKTFKRVINDKSTNVTENKETQTNDTKEVQDTWNQTT